MTANTVPPERQVRAQGAQQQTVRPYILLAAVAHVLLRDRRFHSTVITRAVGAMALASLVKNNQVRPVRRAVHWYTKLGGSRKLARIGPQARQDLARAGQARERPGAASANWGHGPRSWACNLRE